MIVAIMIRWSVALGMIIGGLAGCATTNTPSAALTSLNPQAQQSFRVTWTAEPERDGARLHGYVESSLGDSVTRVQVLGQALDASGNVIGQRVEWVPETIPAFGRGYYEIRKMPPADQYRVSVWSFDRLKGGSM